MKIADIYAIYYELSSGGSVIRGQKEDCLREGKLIAEHYPDSYVEVFRVKDHQVVYRHDNSADLALSV